MACFFCQRTNERKCEPSCGLCDDCPGEDGRPNGMTAADYEENINDYV